jgi:hypothetical protein
MTTIVLHNSQPTPGCIRTFNNSANAWKRAVLNPQLADLNFALKTFINTLPRGRRSSIQDDFLEIPDNNRKFFNLLIQAEVKDHTLSFVKKDNEDGHTTDFYFELYARL